MAVKNADGTVTLKTTGKTGRAGDRGGTPLVKAPLARGAGSGGGPKVRKDKRQVADKNGALKVQK